MLLRNTTKPLCGIYYCSYGVSCVLIGACVQPANSERQAAEVSVRMIRRIGQYKGWKCGNGALVPSSTNCALAIHLATKAGQCEISTTDQRESFKYTFCPVDACWKCCVILVIIAEWRSELEKLFYPLWRTKLSEVSPCSQSNKQKSKI